MKNPIDILSKYQKTLLGVAIFLTLFAVSITINKEGVNLNFKNYCIILSKVYH